MTNKELKQELINKMRKEQEEFEEKLKQKTPEVILNNAYRYATRQDILEEVENVNLTDGEIHSLLILDHPLQFIFFLYVSNLHDYFEDLRYCIRSSAIDKEC